MFRLNHTEQEKIAPMVLNANKILKTYGDHHRKVITCLQGKVWVTQEGDLEDHVLSPGDEMTTYKDGVVLIQALGNASVKVEPPAKPLLH
jgi:hypothetical protein